MRRLALLTFLAGASAVPTATTAREDAYRANNRGVALLEQFQHAEAVKAFEQALALSPGLALARINLAIAEYNVPDLAAAERDAKAAAAASPDAPQPHYILGLVARSQNRTEDGIAELRQVLKVDPSDVGANVNLGQLLMQQREFGAAAETFRKATLAEPYNTTAVYNLGLALTRAGQTEEGQKEMAHFQELRAAGYGTVLAQTYPEQGRYAEALVSTGAEPDVVDPKTPAARFADATSGLPPSAAQSDPHPAADALPPLLFDYDGDGALDVFDARPTSRRLYHNEGGRLVDVTARAGLDPAAGAAGAVAADVDGDGRPDLVVFGPAGLQLFHNGEQGFTDATAASGLGGTTPVTAAALSDVDHDGDVDLLVDRGGLALFRNSGTGTFTDATAAAGLTAEGSAVTLVPTDFDNRRDMDLLRVARGRMPQLFRNLRNGTFRDVAADVGLPAGAAYAAAAAADVNKDGFTDVFFGVVGGPDRLALSNGKSGFAAGDAPLGSSGTTSALFLDYDDDGLVDLVTIGAAGGRVLRDLGASWADVTKQALPEAAALAGARLAAGDIDGDGADDLLLRMPNGGLRLLHDEGGARNHSLTVALAGRVSNRNGVGTKLELRAGSLRQKIETSAAMPPVAPADAIFGLGARAHADALRALWPSGVLQTELIEPPTSAPGRGPRFALAELDRKPSSCPYLYAWNGRGFAFITDFMGGGEMGNQPEPGVYDTPDPDEYVRLTDAQLQPKDGRYELRVTNELEEILFLDRLSLLTVDHPADVEIYPNEGMVDPMPAHRLYAVDRVHAPRAALDDAGRDVRERLARIDRRFVDGFPLSRIRGYADPHTLTLDLGPDSDVLLLSGWTDYAFSSDNVAAHQAGLSLHPPELQMRNAAGRWTTVMTIGFPVGRPQTVVVDLSGKWPSADREVRIATNMRIYWDEAKAGRSVDMARLPRGTARPIRMDLQERGFSAAIAPRGGEAFDFDYRKVAWDARWKLFPGRYTRPGDVRELLASTDDVYVISRPGDEVALSFDAASVPAPRAGWRRTFLLYADGYSKEMDINSATPDAMGPLPFHAMSRYPYAAPEAYPMTDAKRALFERYTTRVVPRSLPLLEAALPAAETSAR